MLKDKLRDPISGLTHLGAAILSLLGLIALVIITLGETPKLVSSIIYGITLIAMFSASATYHMTISSPKVIEILRKVDHAAIYLLIAGTYTPFCIIAFSGFWQWGLLSIIWSLAFIGVGIKVFIVRAPRWVNAGVYLIMGWLVITAIGEMVNTLPAISITWLIIGGIIYTLGAIVYITKKMDFKPGIFGFHEVWHIFVILAAVAHYISILVFIRI
ncbi:MAG: hemolysin III family protein [Anaerolineae bacterium]|jgi:hemolysin III|nr:hemolysin III family protein [Anaerolineae bacterium]MBT7075410.1 hemolysin III family protein [Anaerolineae bacterium]MBT7782747.1 hemolysin III family protein [Anaerolineae bacterium]